MKKYTKPAVKATTVNVTVVFPAKSTLCNSKSTHSAY